MSLVYLVGQIWRLTFAFIGSDFFLPYFIFFSQVSFWDKWWQRNRDMKQVEKNNKVEEQMSHLWWSVVLLWRNSSRAPCCYLQTKHWQEGLWRRGVGHGGGGGWCIVRNNVDLSHFYLTIIMGEERLMFLLLWHYTPNRMDAGGWRFEYGYVGGWLWGMQSFRTRNCCISPISCKEPTFLGNCVLKRWLLVCRFLACDRAMEWEGIRSLWGCFQGLIWPCRTDCFADHDCPNCCTNNTACAWAHIMMDPMEHHV